jgi:hypothetical protein
MKRVASRTDEGEKIKFNQDVVKIPVIVDEETAGTKIKNLGKKYGVDAILGGTIEVYAEIIRSTGEENDDTFFTDVQLSEGQYALKLEVYLEWTLYDARSGAVISNNDKAKSEFVAMQMAEKTIYPLPNVIPGDFKDLYRFIASTQYAEFFRKAIQDKIKEYAYLFIPHYRMIREEVKEE